jgi:hypothetical protein
MLAVASVAASKPTLRAAEPANFFSTLAVAIPTFYDTRPNCNRRMVRQLTANFERPPK